tara:strand:+ start:1136 stop:1639 length:504 start_codon:yes stop_codon:yes gene_type:complete
MNILSANEKEQYEVVAKINNSEDEDYQSNIELSMPERFYPKLSKNEIETLETPFCVDDMVRSKCFSSHKRSIRIIKKYRDLYGLKEGYSLNDIIEVFKGKTMYVVRRALDDNGNKIDDKYVVVEGTVKTIKPMIGDEYDCTNLVMNFYDTNEEEKISIDRAFFKKTS